MVLKIAAFSNFHLIADFGNRLDWKMGDSSSSADEGKRVRSYEDAGRCKKQVSRKKYTRKRKFAGNQWTKLRTSTDENTRRQSAVS